MVDSQPADDAERNDIGSGVGRKGFPRWLWPALDHRSSAMLACVLGTHTDQVCVALPQPIAPVGMTRFDTDDGDTYPRHVPPEQPVKGKTSTHTIENI